MSIIPRPDNKNIRELIVLVTPISGLSDFTKEDPSKINNIGSST